MQTPQNFFKTLISKARLLLFGFEKKEDEIRTEAQKILNEAVAKADERKISELKNKISKL